MSGRRRPPQPAAAGSGGALSLDEVLSAVEASVALVDIGDGAGIWQAPNVVLPGYRRLFGGQLLAQAIAAVRSPGKVVRSLHLVFIAEGRPDTAVSWSVDALQDGRTFATRSVVALQGERVLATGLVSLHAPDASGHRLEHSIAPPIVPPPAGIAAIPQLGALAFETRPVLLDEALVRGPLPPVGHPHGHLLEPFWLRLGYASVPKPQPETPPAPGDAPAPPPTPSLDGLAVGPPELAVWMRSPRPLREAADQLSHQALLAYASDVTMMVAAMRPHAGVGFGSPAVEASAVTTHTISFHRPFRVDEWLLFVQESPAAAGGRAYVRGDWFDEGGEVVASCAQEILIRLAGD
ncbi:MAG: acyl-CoA thioesterase [Acidimicrobiales bacterium]